jgi:molecular chaperone GrpE
MGPKIPIEFQDGNGVKNSGGEKNETVAETAAETSGAQAVESEAEEQNGEAGGNNTGNAAAAAAAQAYYNAQSMTEETPPETPLPQSPLEPPAEQRAAEYLDMLQRLKAEFENYKKRVRREQADTIRYANEQLLLKLLPVLDNLRRGIEASRQAGLDESIIEGIAMVERQFIDALQEYGVAPFESLNLPFDPNRQEAMTALERDDVEENTVIMEMERGYVIHDRVLRVARVIVSRKPASDEAPEAPDGE